MHYTFAQIKFVIDIHIVQNIERLQASQDTGGKGAASKHNFCDEVGYRASVEAPGLPGDFFFNETALRSYVLKQKGKRRHSDWRRRAQQQSDGADRSVIESCRSNATPAGFGAWTITVEPPPAWIWIDRACRQ